MRIEDRSLYEPTYSYSPVGRYKVECYQWMMVSFYIAKDVATNAVACKLGPNQQWKFTFGCTAFGEEKQCNYIAGRLYNEKQSWTSIQFFIESVACGNELYEHTSISYLQFALSKYSVIFYCRFFFKKPAIILNITIRVKSLYEPFQQLVFFKVRYHFFFRIIKYNTDTNNARTLTPMNTRA